MSKETAVVFPLFLLLYAYAYNKSKFRTAPFFFAAGFYVILRLTLLNFSEGTFLAQTPIYLRLLTSVKNIFAYLGLLAAPVGLHMERDVAFVASIFSLKVMLSVVLLFAIALWMARIREKKPDLFFFFAWFFFWLIPVSNIIPLNATLAEHWLYMPSMGIFAAVGLAFAAILDRMKNKKDGPVIRAGIIAALISAIAVYGWLTIKRNNAWRDPLSIYSDAKKYVPRNYKVRNNLGRAYLEKNMIDKAVEEFEASVEIQPLYAEAHSNLGFAYECKGLYEKAIAEYNKALELNPRLLRTYRNMTNLYLKMGDRKRADDTIRRASLYSPQRT